MLKFFLFFTFNFREKLLLFFLLFFLSIIFQFLTDDGIKFSTSNVYMNSSAVYQIFIQPMALSAARAKCRMLNVTERLVGLNAVIPYHKYKARENDVETENACA